MFKKYLIILLCAAALLTSCAENQTDNDDPNAPHKHTSDSWERNISEHWKVCDCGESFNREEHTIEDNACTVCESEIWTYDGGADIYNYNENGDIIRITCYDENGEVISENATYAEYDENGNKIKESTYENGLLIIVSEYAVTESGKTYQKSVTSYLLDGSRDVYEYDENGNELKNTSFDSDGNVKFEVIYEYAENKDGNLYQAKIIHNDYEGETVFIHEFEENGDTVLLQQSYMNGEVFFKEHYEREYDENGNTVSEKHYIDGVLVDEVTEYTNISTPDGTLNFPKKNIEYLPDGGTKISEYNDHGELISEMNYDASGVLGEYYICECEYDENDNLTSKKTYINGALTTEEEYALDKDGWSYLASETYHYPDMEVSYLSTYNEYGDQTSRIVFDGDGNKTEEDIFEFEYDENGNKASEKHYKDGVLTYEATDFMTSTDNFGWFRFPATTVEYYEDGSKSVCKKDGSGEIVSETYYAADGTVLSELRHESEYFETGELKSKKVYENGKATSEEHYAIDTNGIVYFEKEVVYSETGARFETVYNEFFEILSETEYDADGTVVDETKYEYTTDMEALRKTIKVYKNGSLETEEIQITDEFGLPVRREKKTVYFEDGSKIVTEYDENSEIVSEKAYDINGNEIAE